MRVEVDQNRCVGSGQCLGIAPQIFDQDETSGRVVLLDESPPDSLSDEVHEAVDICPARAIRIVAD